MRPFSIRSNNQTSRGSGRDDDDISLARLNPERAFDLRSIDDGERPNPIQGTDGDDHLIGTDAKDAIWAMAGNDTVEAGGGDDLIRAGGGNDEVYGGAGNDRMAGARGADTLSGGDGDDLMYGGPQDDVLTGGEGADQFLFKIGHASGRPVREAGDDVVTDFSLEEGDTLRIAGTQHMTTNFEYGDSDNDGLDDYTVISFTLNSRENDGEVILPEGLEIGTITLEGTLVTADDLGL